MKIIFLKDVPRIGRRNEVKEVANGYGRHLVTSGVATLATDSSLSHLEKKMLADASQKKVHTDILMKNLDDLNGAMITLYGKANEKGHLFAAIHKDQVLIALKQQAHLDMHPDYVMLDHPLKALGTFEIPVEIENKKAAFKVVVEPGE